jgi:serine/threonine-protein kinase
MADVFVSYKREDAAKVRKIVAALRQRGLDAWWDEDIPASAQWEATIEKALKAAKTVVVCWSPASVASENVRSEARVAREDGRLIQVFLKPCQPPLFFGERQGIDLSKWRGNAEDEHVAKLVESVRKIAAGERVEGGERPGLARIDRRIATIAAALLLLVLAAGAAWWWPGPARPSGPTTLAVLPFRALNPSDANLVDGIWDDTRGALGRNPNLRVIGRESMQALAGRQLVPADYRRKTGADYLLDGSVEHVGDQVQMKLSLTRTDDGAEVWSDQLGGKLDDVFAFQQRIASEVEGRIRGRVAPGGGATAKNIATSGDVYAIYAEARARLRLRNPDTHPALPLLEKAVAMDPNYAPAWADLAEAVQLRAIGSGRQGRDEALRYVHRALTLAPNLAHAYAVAGFVGGCGRDSEANFRKAIALDPSDAEAWMWLGNCMSGENRLKDSLVAYARAVQIEPLWFTSMYNKMDTLAALADQRGLAIEVRRAEATGDPLLSLRARQNFGSVTGRVADAVRNGIEIHRRFPDQERKGDMAQALMTMGFIEEVRAMFDLPQAETEPYRGIPFSAADLRKRHPIPADFWRDDDTPMIHGRLLARNGRLGEWVGWYKAAFRNVDEYYSTVAWESWELFADQAPNVAALLRSAGEDALARPIVDKDEAIIAPLLRNGPANWQMAWRVAQLRAVEGRDNEAMVMLRRAVNTGFLPTGGFFARDIAEEPSFARLTNRADFQAVRRDILNRIANQRRQITFEMLSRAGLEPTGSKAVA